MTLLSAKALLMESHSKSYGKLRKQPDKPGESEGKYYSNLIQESNFSVVIPLFMNEKITHQKQSPPSSHHEELCVSKIELTGL